MPPEYVWARPAGKKNTMKQTLLLAIALALALLIPLNAGLAASHTTPARAVANQDLLGMVIRDPWYDFGTNPAIPEQPNTLFQDTMGATLAQIGAHWVRMDIHVASDTNVTGEIAKNDYFITQVAPRYGFKILVLLNFDLVQNQDPRQLNSTSYISSTFGGGVNAYMDTWLQRALTVADRYGSQIAAYEVLNEENRLPQTSPNGPSGDAIDPGVVGRLITKLYRFCRHIQPLPTNEPVHGCSSASILLGGLQPRGTSNSSGATVLTDAQYLQAVYQDPQSFAGFKNDPSHPYYPVDGVGYHPYPQEILLSPNDAEVNHGIDRMRQALITVGDSCRPLWVTEIGYNVGFDPDGSAGPTPPQTAQGQANFLQDIYSSLGARQICGHQLEIPHIFWFKYEDFPPDSGPDAQNWGIVHIPFSSNSSCPGGACYALNGAPDLYRPAYFVYRQLAGLPVYQSYAPQFYH